jgi:hypothetical protein
VFDDDGMLVVDMTASLCIEGFRAWVTDDRARLEKCNYDFGGCENAEVNPHYRLSERYWPGPAPHDADVSLQSTGGVGFAGMASRHCSRVCLSRVTDAYSGGSDSASLLRPAISTGTPRRNRGIETVGRQPSSAPTAWVCCTWDSEEAEGF